ncbi:MAG TPA: TIGR01458 family HAD-type hydrolase [Thermomicrobiales bacterium]|jgi:HAD superfamily hydrolase (TIGR01458 family)
MENEAMRGVLFDVDGVLHVGMRAVPGAAEAIERLGERGIRVRFMTNTTTARRATLAAGLRGIGLPVRDEELMTAPVATAGYVKRRWPGARCYLIAKGDVAEEFVEAGVALVADEGDEAAGVVVIGGAEERLTYERMNRAFRMLLGGATLVAMHRNRSWRTAAGMQLDSGPFVTALEEASGVRAVTVGKPALPFFRQGLRAIGVPARAVAMVGDDAVNDLAPARRLGMRTILVRTGKPVGEREEAMAEVTIDSVAELAGALARLAASGAA